MPAVKRERLRFALRVLLLLSVLTQGLAMPLLGKMTVDAHPELSWLFAPALVWSFAVIACAQVLLLMMLQLVTLAEGGRLFHEGVTGWMYGLLTVIFVGASLLVLGDRVLARLDAYPPGAGIGIWGLLISGALVVIYLSKVLWLIRTGELVTAYQALAV